MKLYRIVPAALNPGGGTLGYYHGPYGSFESLYYDLGYVSFNGEFNKGSGNSISRRISEIGKYCYFFLEDAIYYLACNQIQHSNIKLLEYEVPEDVAFNLAGYGEYGNGDFIFPVIDYKSETYITKTSFGGEVGAGNQISKEDKIKAMISEIRKMYSALELLYVKENDLFLPAWFEKAGIKSITEASDELIVDAYKEFCPFTGFLENNHELIKTNMITNNSCMLVFRFDMRGEVRKTNEELLSNANFLLDYSKEACEFRDSVTSLFKEGNVEAAKEYMRNRK